MVTAGQSLEFGSGDLKPKSPEDETAPGLLPQRLAAPEGL